MKAIISLLVSLFLVAAVPSFASAFESIYCFDYYEFQNAITFENFQTEKTSYSPGDTVKIMYDLTSNMKAPIVEGFTRVQMFYMDPEKGEMMIDEFFSSKDIYLMQGDSVRQKIEWTVPSKAKEGEYVAKIYFMVGDMFNLAGLSIVPYGPPGVPGDMTTFQVTNGGNSRIYFDKDSVYLNGEPYAFGDFVPILNTSEAIKIAADLVNDGDAKDVELNLKIYEWDDLTKTPIAEYTVTKTVTVETNGKQNIVFETPPLAANAYEVKFTAASGEEKSVLKIRFGVSGSRGRFIYAGLSDFPLKAGETYTAFVCMSNAADHINYFNGKGTVKLVDENGNVVYSGSFGPTEISPAPMGLGENFTADKTITKGTLVVELQDSEGKVVDSADLVYDYSKFPNIPAELTLSVDKDSYQKGEMVQYTVDYSAKGIPLEGSLLIYFIKPDGTVMYTKETAINGQYKGKIKMVGADGTYTLKVRELTHDLVAEKGIASSKATPTASSTVLYGIIAAIIVIALLLYVRFRK
jgi:hypothetical protein